MRREYRCPTCGHALDAVLALRRCPRCDQELPSAYVQHPAMIHPVAAGQEDPSDYNLDVPAYADPVMEAGWQHRVTRRTGWLAGCLAMLVVLMAGVVAVAFLDLDGDGWPTHDELYRHTSPWAADTDGDRLPDAWEHARQLNPRNNDTDGDGWADGYEILAGTDPRVADTDGDGEPDSTDASTERAVCPGDARCELQDPMPLGPNLTQAYAFGMTGFAIVSGLLARTIRKR